MLRAAVAAALFATAYCGAKGPPQPPAREAPDAGAPSSAPTSTSPSAPTPARPTPPGLNGKCVGRDNAKFLHLPDPILREAVTWFLVKVSQFKSGTVKMHQNRDALKSRSFGELAVE